MTWKAGFVQFSWKRTVLKKCAWPEKCVLYNFHGRRTVFSFWREFQARVMILRTLPLQNAIWPKPAAHDLKRAFCTIFMKSALFYRLEENLRAVSRFWELWRSKIRFGQNLLRMTWKAGFVQFCKAHCFSALKKIWGQFHDFENFDLAKNVLRMTWKERFCTIFMESALFSRFDENFRPRDDFENFDAPKCDLAKTCCAWPEKSVLDNFIRKRTVFPIWREFQASVTILRTLTLKNCAPFFCFQEKRMTWKAHCFSALERIWGQFDDFENFDAQKCDLAKTCCAWPEKSVLYNFHGKRTVF